MLLQVSLGGFALKLGGFLMYKSYVIIVKLFLLHQKNLNRRYRNHNVSIGKDDNNIVIKVMIDNG